MTSPRTFLEDECPICGARLTYNEGGRGYSRAVGVVLRGVYDGVLYWVCPDCNGRFHRFAPGHYLYPKADRWMRMRQDGEG